MKWFQPILPLLLTLALPCEAADPLPPAEIAELRAQRKTLGQEALLKIGEKKYRAAIPLLEECNRIQEKIGVINTPNPAVVLGDAAYGSPKPPLKPDRLFHSLPHSKAETQAMAKALGDNTQMLTGTEASEARLKKIVRPRVLLLSSHAVYFRSLPPLELTAGEALRLYARNPLLRCGIALAGVNALTARPTRMADDGLFTGMEAAQLDLHGTELVILSACESSVGEIHAGEGAMSLRRAGRARQSMARELCRHAIAHEKLHRPLAIRCAPRRGPAPRPARAAPKRRSLQSLFLGCLYPHRPMALIFKK